MRFGIFIYDGAEPIDLATFGVLSMARRVAPDIEICTIAPAAGTVALANGLRVVAEHGIADAPACDVVIVTGGPGWVRQTEAPATLAYLRRVRASGRRIASVCTGGMILAAAGLLGGGPATTKRETVPPEIPPISLMRKRYPDIDVRAALLIDRGDGVVTGGGVALCIDTTLYLLAELLGREVAEETARILEYSRAWRVNREGFASHLAAGPNWPTVPPARPPEGRRAGRLGGAAAGLDPHDGIRAIREAHVRSLISGSSSSQPPSLSDGAGFHLSLLEAKDAAPTTLDQQRARQGWASAKSRSGT
jgi:transcriptional regulator GlxA family with amidase domain